MSGLLFIAIGHFSISYVFFLMVYLQQVLHLLVSQSVSEGVYLKAWREKRMKSELEMGNGSDVGSFFLDPKLLF